MSIDTYIKRLKEAKALPTKTVTTVDCAAVVELLASGEPVVFKCSYAGIKIVNSWCRQRGLVFKYKTLTEGHYEAHINFESLKVYKPAVRKLPPMPKAVRLKTHKADSTITGQPAN